MERLETIKKNVISAKWIIKMLPKLDGDKNNISKGFVTPLIFYRPDRARAADALKN